MKKVALSLLALTLAGAVAFAEDAAAPVLKFSGYVDSGVKAVSTADGVTFQSYASDFDDVGTWAYLTATYGTDKAGVKLRLRSNAASSPVWHKAYVWTKPVTGLTLTAGKSYAGTFAGVDDNGEDFFNADSVSAVYSIAGLTVGTGLKATYDGNAADTGLFGAAYSLDKVIDLAATLKTKGKEEVVSYAVSASLTAVDKLTLSGGYNAYVINNEASDDYSVFADGTLGYALTDALSAQVTGYAYFKPTEYFDVTPKVSYAFTPAVSAFAQVGIVTGDDATYVPKTGASLAVDAATLGCTVAYDTLAEATTATVDLVYSF